MGLFRSVIHDARPAAPVARAVVAAPHQAAPMPSAAPLDTLAQAAAPRHAPTPMDHQSPRGDMQPSGALARPATATPGRFPGPIEASPPVRREMSGEHSPVTPGAAHSFTQRESPATHDGIDIDTVRPAVPTTVDIPTTAIQIHPAPVHTPLSGTMEEDVVVASRPAVTDERQVSSIPDQAMPGRPQYAPPARQSNDPHVEARAAIDPQGVTAKAAAQSPNFAERRPEPEPSRQPASDQPSPPSPRAMSPDGVAGAPPESTQRVMPPPVIAPDRVAEQRPGRVHQTEPLGRPDAARPQPAEATQPIATPRSPDQPQPARAAPQPLRPPAPVRVERPRPPPQIIEVPRSPEVRIGQVDVFVERPARAASPARSSARPAVSLASRHYLRGL